MEVSGQLYATAALPLGKQVSITHCAGGWVGPKAGLHFIGKRSMLPLRGIKPGFLGRPARGLVAILTELPPALSRKAQCAVEL
jgi:hypothetical protein